MSIKVYTARQIITMNPSQPLATHIAVKDGRILAVGPEQAMQGLGDYEIDTRFADTTLMPGFVEGHSHALEGTMWNYVYLGYFARKDPEGRLWEGVRSIPEIQQRLREQAALKPAGEPLLAWGLDPIYFDGERLNRYLLDEAVADRPVVVFHASFHVMTVNSAMLELAGIKANSNIEGIVEDANGEPNGELQELAGMHAVFSKLNLDFFQGADADSLKRYGRAARNAGVTTAADLGNPLTEKSLAALQEATGDPAYPLRLAPALVTFFYTTEEGLERMQQVLDAGNDKLKIGMVKIMTDGSIQGYTARMKWPYYHDGHGNGIWNAPPETLVEMIHAYHQAGLQIHIHTNGDEAVELALDAIEEALTLWPRPDHRHTLQHCQVIDHAQMRRAAKLGICLNMFANHIYYWGDIHRSHTIGYERSQRLEPVASARRLGITTAIHCDAPVTPLGPLFTAWCAVQRKTASGQVLGEHERISVEEALQMITLDAAYTLKLDHLVGSLEVGKFADMAVLEQNPLEVDPDQLRDIRVRATLVGGVEHVAD